MNELLLQPPGTTLKIQQYSRVYILDFQLINAQNEAGKTFN